MGMKGFVPATGGILHFGFTQNNSRQKNILQCAFICLQLLSKRIHCLLKKKGFEENSDIIVELESLAA
ncbi:MAG: hypothetical protein ACYSW4_06880 [Planctomycetota bacterium]